MVFLVIWYFKIQTAKGARTRSPLRVKIFRNFDQDLVKINQNLEKIDQNLKKIDQNLGKSLSKGLKNIKILSHKGSIFDFRLGHTLTSQTYYPHGLRIEK